MQLEDSPAPITPRVRVPSQHGAAYFEALAEQLWEPTSPRGCEASVALRYLAKLQRLHERSLCTRAQRLLACVVNRLHGVRT